MPSEPAIVAMTTAALVGPVVRAGDVADAVVSQKAANHD
jgi:hypothetical protein